MTPTELLMAEYSDVMLVENDKNRHELHYLNGFLEFAMPIKIRMNDFGDQYLKICYHEYIYLFFNKDSKKRLK